MPCMSSNGRERIAKASWSSENFKSHLAQAMMDSTYLAMSSTMYQLLLEISSESRHVVDLCLPCKSLFVHRLLELDLGQPCPIESRQAF